MGCVPSSLRPGEANSLVSSLQAQVAGLQQAAGGQQCHAEVLFFPDAAMPCKYGRDCRRNACTFSHQQTSLTRLMSLLSSARTSIDVCVFTITCDEISDALLDAHRRGVRVRVITDNDQAANTGSDIARLRSAGVPVATDADTAHMHHKFAIIDRRMLCNGSFNWTRQAVLANQENCVVTDHGGLVRDFGTQFEALWNKYTARR